GYAVSEVKGEDLTKARENNLMNSLSGKVPGLDIGSTAGGAGSATSVIIRGISSLSQTNQPLYVVNGVPMENQPVGLNNANPNGNSGSQWDNAPDLGDAVGNLNPDDIESISVLKGAAAAALYGYRAKAGVILITTKSGKGSGIEFNTNYVAEQVVDRTDWQQVYGQGANGLKPTTALAAGQAGGSSYGAALDGSSIIQFDGVSRPYSAQKNNMEDFYGTGGTWTNTIALNKSFDGGSLRLAGNTVDNNSIVPNSGLNRQSFNLAGIFTPIKRLNIDTRLNYILEQVKNRPMVSDGAGNANYNAIFLPTSVNINDLKPWRNADNSERLYNPGNVYATNPW
ncbi:MAG: SusC/RagA family TonB-linked outer membrane protein, partial [Pedobacter sp.]